MDENGADARNKAWKSPWKMKPERRLGANHDDAVNMLEKCGENAGKCDNNETKWQEAWFKK